MPCNLHFFQKHFDTKRVRTNVPNPTKLLKVTQCYLLIYISEHELCWIDLPRFMSVHQSILIEKFYVFITLKYAKKRIMPLILHQSLPAVKLPGLKKSCCCCSGGSRLEKCSDILLYTVQNSKFSFELSLSVVGIFFFRPTPLIARQCGKAYAKSQDPGMTQK